MMKSIVLVLVLLSALASYGQAIESKTFYKEPYKSVPVEEDKAKYVEIVLNKDGVKTYEYRRLRDNLLLDTRSYKNDLPTGVWASYSKSGIRTSHFNYAFESPYADKKIENAPYFNIFTSALEDKLEGQFEAPILTGYTSFRNYILKNLRYPAEALKAGIEGKVRIHLAITETGKVELISIYQGKEKHLDKEAARLIHELPSWKPAKLNGEAIKVYSIVDLNFGLQ